MMSGQGGSSTVHDSFQSADAASNSTQGAAAALATMTMMDVQQTPMRSPE